MVRLYQCKDSPYCHRVRIVLAEKELDYQTIWIDLSKNEQKTDQFTRLNPLGKVPVLVDEDHVVSDSLLINEYLNEEYPFPELMPEDPQSRSHVRVWSNRIDAMVYEPLWTLKESASKTLPAEQIEEAKKLLSKFFELAEKNLRDKEYLVGNYSLADVAFAPLLELFETAGVKIPENLTNVKAWMSRLERRTSVVKTK